MTEIELIEFDEPPYLNQQVPTCRGMCQGFKYVPVRRAFPYDAYQANWNDYNVDPDMAVWAFVRCPDCGGSGV